MLKIAFLCYGLIGCFGYHGFVEWIDDEGIHVCMDTPQATYGYILTNRIKYPNRKVYYLNTVYLKKQNKNDRPGKPIYWDEKEIIPSVQR